MRRWTRFLHLYSKFELNSGYLRDRQKDDSYLQPRTHVSYIPEILHVCMIDIKDCITDWNLYDVDKFSGVRPLSWVLGDDELKYYYEWYAKANKQIQWIITETFSFVKMKNLYFLTDRYCTNIKAFFEGVRGKSISHPPCSRLHSQEKKLRRILIVRLRPFRWLHKIQCVSVCLLSLLDIGSLWIMFPSAL